MKEEPLESAFRPSAVTIVLLAMAIRVFALTGEQSADSLVYAQSAWNLAEGTFTLASDSWYVHRIPVFLPVAPLYGWLGPSAATTSLWPLALSLIQLVLVMAVGRKYFGVVPALIAGFLVAVYPLDVVESSRLLPDVVIGGLLSTAGGLWLLGTHPGDRPGSGRVLAAGIALALAVVVRPYALLLLAYLGADSVLRRVPLRSWVPLFLGMAAVTFPLLAAYWIQTGDPLYRGTVISQAYASGVMAEDPQWLYYVSHIWSPKRITGLFPLLFVVCGLLALLRPDRVRVSLLLWISIFFGFLQFGSMSLGEFVPVLKRTRFLTVLTFPACLLSGAVLASLAGYTQPGHPARATPVATALARLSRWALPGGLAVLLALCVWIVSRGLAEKRERVRVMETIADHIKDLPETPVLLDHWRSAIRLAYYLDYGEGAYYYRGAEDAMRMSRARMPESSRFAYLSWYADPDSLPAGFILIDDRVIEAYRTSAHRRLTFRKEDIPAYALDPPPRWRPVVEGGGIRLYWSN